MKPKIYLIGKITDHKDYEIDFYLAEFRFNFDYKVLNPVKICRKHWSWLKCICKLTKVILRKKPRYYHIVNKLDNSYGAQIELMIMEKIGAQEIL